MEAFAYAEEKSLLIVKKSTSYSSLFHRLKSSSYSLGGAAAVLDKLPVSL